MTGPLLIGNALQYVFGPVLFLLSVFMILLILVQRGRGGGLAGALGGMGGQSAFGSKAGDVFTTITVVTSTIWALLCCLAIACLNPQMRVPPPAQPTLTTESDESSTPPLGTDQQDGATGNQTPGSDQGNTEQSGAGEKKTTGDGGAAAAPANKAGEKSPAGEKSTAGEDSAKSGSSTESEPSKEGDS